MTYRLVLLCVLCVFSRKKTKHTMMYTYIHTHHHHHQNSLLHDTTSQNRRPKDRWELRFSLRSSRWCMRMRNSVTRFSSTSVSQFHSRSLKKAALVETKQFGLGSEPQRSECQVEHELGKWKMGKRRSHQSHNERKS